MPPHAPAPLTLVELRALMERLNFNRHLGMRVVERHRDGVTIECPIRTEYLNLHNTLHGGVTAAVVDVAAGFAVIALSGGQPTATVELKVNYIRPVTGSRIRARARLLRAGKTLCVCRVDVHDDKRHLAATGLVTYILLPPDRPLKA